MTAPDEIEAWMTAPTEEALEDQRPLPDGALKIVTTGERKDEPASPSRSSPRSMCLVRQSDRRDARQRNIKHFSQE
jgi:putative SOS response-associated peptidase YedK